MSQQDDLNTFSFNENLVFTLFGFLLGLTIMFIKDNFKESQEMKKEQPSLKEHSELKERKKNESNVFDKVSNNRNFSQMFQNTPLVYIESLSNLTGCRIYAKCEYYLPYTSKDRMIKNIIETSIKNGDIKEDTTIYEGSSGSTCYSVAAIARIYGLKSKMFIPDDVSEEKLRLLETTGAEIVVTKQCPYSNFKSNYNRMAKKLARKDPKGFFINQFYNTINYKTHFEQTGPEIVSQVNEKIDAFVCSAGTGGTIKGISNYLKQLNSETKIILADINGSGLSSFVKHGVLFAKEETESMRKKYRYYSVIEGIGINFLTDNFQESKIDDCFLISDQEAIFMARYVYEKDGIFIGGSSAVNLCAVLKAARIMGRDKTLVTVLFDSGMKYASKIFGKDIKLDITSINEI